MYVCVLQGKQSFEALAKVGKKRRGVKNLGACKSWQGEAHVYFVSDAYVLVCLCVCVMVMF